MQMEWLQDGLAEAVPVCEKWPSNIKKEVAMDIRSLQKPLKEQYRNDPNASTGSCAGFSDLSARGLGSIFR
jgi:hypothetical protein